MNISAANAVTVAAATSAALGRRLVTGLILAICAVLAVRAGGVAFLTVVSALTAIVTFEWIRMSCREGSHGTLLVALIAVSASAAVMAIWGAGWALITAAIGALAVGSVAKFENNKAILVAAGMAVFILSLVSTVWLRAENTTGLVTIYWLFTVIWATDSGAYLIGSAVGGARLAPRISPAKTWVGALGGLAVGILSAIALAFLLSTIGVLEATPNLAAIIAASALLSIFAQAGDLAESGAKRFFGVKDSGSWLPGHGGALDRLDSLIFVTPIVALAVLLAGGSRHLIWAGS
ncbi:MAG: phosphatidate cytidylyltransferase [Alphaproteobacteria bacterium]|jgi:phosphatidate cytidylyltransferase|nr:phosphatidate cytidylyltransferase [Alphaproteobacteria bacterium]MDP6591317.1 phosphatidate cytidylyltransferase [Alphaproteobacteria bacterium]MDP6817541.1 phosphatidate cytidylyltransferase [Alphaproteobacteria bacterium]|tara:strand:- start:103 stop:978 length:876 start_codon:yes stop_codon:yes gene_type:complete